MPYCKFDSFESYFHRDMRFQEIGSGSVRLQRDEITRVVVLGVNINMFLIRR